MTLETLIDLEEVSDAGDVAGRVGFRYQDHVGASFFLEMLRDSSLEQIEFETADDITLRWNFAGQKAIEYVQVKTTEEDKKWSIKEISTRDKGRVGTSLIEKSLLCDVNPGKALFRFVTRRDVGTSLRPFLVSRDKRRTIQPKIDASVESFAKKFKTVRSACGRSTRDWASKLLWVVAGSMPAIRNLNINLIIQLAEQTGEVPSHKVAQEIYQRLLTLVSDAADASRVSDPDAKAVSREAGITWWRERVGEIRDLNRENIHVYRVSTRPFFSDLHQLDDDDIHRSLRAYDVEFDERQWRAEDLIGYLLGWLPELSLPAKVLAEYNHLQARDLARRATERIEQHQALADDAILANLMLHAVLRHYFDSEPIACKIYHGVGPGRSSTSAHIVPGEDSDQLWIGRSQVTTASSHSGIVKTVIAELEAALASGILRKERDLIITLREPRHMRSSSLDTVLSANGKIEDLRKCLHCPVLIAYDSTVLNAGFSEDYLLELREEVVEQYDLLKSELTPGLNDVRIHIFLIPVEKPSELISNFGKRLRGEL